MVAALRAETDRGKACVADAMIDEIIKEMFSRRLIKAEREVRDIVSFGRPLGSHGARLKIAYLLGWIGPDSYHDCDKIHSIRNRMAHDLDVDTFEHVKVRDLIKALKAPKHVDAFVTRSGNDTRRLNLKRPADQVLLTIMTCIMRCWDSLDRAKRQRPGKDAEIFAGPRRIAAYLTNPRIPTAPIP